MRRGFKIGRKGGGKGAQVVIEVLLCDPMFAFLFFSCHVMCFCPSRAAGSLLLDGLEATSCRERAARASIANPFKPESSSPRC